MNGFWQFLLSYQTSPKTMFYLDFLIDDIILNNEGYTIGKVLEFILYNQFYLGDKSVSFVGFIKKHPHDKDGLLRIAFRNSADLTEALRYLMIALTQASEIFNSIAAQF